jgi:hypothetical protein
MSSVESDIDCPTCGYEEATEYCHKSGFFQAFCKRCGFCHVVDPDKEINTVKGGVGSFCITSRNGVRSLGGLPKAKPLVELKREFRTAMRSLDVLRIEFTLKVNGVWQTFVAKDFPEPGSKKNREPKATGGKRNPRAQDELKFEELDPSIPV